MGGGHYVTYAKNPNEKWYCYNDSSCKVRSQLCLFFDISDVFHYLTLLLAQRYFCKDGKFLNNEI